MWIEVDTNASKQGLKGIWVPLPLPGYAVSSTRLLTPKFGLMETLSFEDHQGKPKYSTRSGN